MKMFCQIIHIFFICFILHAIPGFFIWFFVSLLSFTEKTICFLILSSLCYKIIFMVYKNANIMFFMKRLQCIFQNLFVSCL